MKNRLLFLLLVLTGCIPCWNPFYTEKDLAFDFRLVGTWKPADAETSTPEVWTFSKRGDRSYGFQHTDGEGLKASFEAHLVRLNDRFFLDLYLVNIDSDAVKMNSLASLSIAPAHLVFRLEQFEPTLKIAAMNPSWMKEFLKRNPEGIAHRQIGEDHIILTASTAELQKFVLTHMDEQEFFGTAMELKRNR